MSTGREDSPAKCPAVVVGLCSHGLATVRALHDRGVDVHALEANRSLPAVRTSAARVHFANKINGPEVVDELVRLRPELPGDDRPVLFLMNDNMVREIGNRWDRLERFYRLSWSGSRSSIARLLQKSELEAHCDRVGLAYPESMVFAGVDDLQRVRTRFEPPFIVKPVRPLSRFKVRLLDSYDALRQLAVSFASELPFLVQQWVPGGDEQIVFIAFVLDAGTVVAEFGGGKLRSFPVALGQTTMAESRPVEDVRVAALKFFEPLHLSGPVSLELKRDPRGALWVIEPTLGRTDYWLACCTANGVNLPWVEYCLAAGRELPVTRQAADRVWVDSERDPKGVWWYLTSSQGFWSRRSPLTFPYLRIGDLGPFLAASRIAAGRVSRAVFRRIRRAFPPRPRA